MRAALKSNKNRTKTDNIQKYRCYSFLQKEWANPKMSTWRVDTEDYSEFELLKTVMGRGDCKNHDGVVTGNPYPCYQKRIGGGEGRRGAQKAG